MKRNFALHLLYPPFSERLIKGMKAAKLHGFELGIYETYRTYERQSYIYNQGRARGGVIVTRERPGRSWANYGLAADLVPLIDQKWAFDSNSYKKAAPYLEMCGLRWLGKDPKLVNIQTYELPIKLSIYQVQEIHQDCGIIGLWAKLDEQYGGR